MGFSKFSFIFLPLFFIILMSCEQFIKQFSLFHEKALHHCQLCFESKLRITQFHAQSQNRKEYSREKIDTGETTFIKEEKRDAANEAIKQI